MSKEALPRIHARGFRVRDIHQKKNPLRLSHTVHTRRARNHFARARARMSDRRHPIPSVRRGAILSREAASALTMIRS
jgi:hypothetical protein